jgi:hypothetical protein
MAEPNRYAQIIERIFLGAHKKGEQEVLFSRTDIENVAAELGIKLPKNIGDVIYSFRYRVALPDAIQKRAPGGKEWIIRPAGRGKYCFVATSLASIEPTKGMAEIKIPDATPGVITMYALNDEQALLAKLRYNRLIDIFTRVTCYPLQSHLRTAVPTLGQVETDEVYIGVDRRGAHYVFPVQAKGKRDRLNVVQIEQDVAMCRHKFPNLICRPIAAQFTLDDLIVLFEFEEAAEQIVISREKHYRLAPPKEINKKDLAIYRERSMDD